MAKLFIILLAVGFIVAMVFISIMKAIRRFFSNFQTKPNVENQTKYKNEEILYKKDDVIVLKGDAKSEENKD